jgi:TonB family protein
VVELITRDKDFLYMNLNIFKAPFNINHAAAISIIAHFVFLSIQPFDFFNKPIIPEKKYKKFRLEIIKRPQISPKIKKQLNISEPKLFKSKKPIISKPTIVLASKPTRQFKSKPIQAFKIKTGPLKSRTSKNIKVITSASIQKSDFKTLKHYTTRQAVRKFSKNSNKIFDSYNTRTANLTALKNHKRFDGAKFEAIFLKDKVNKVNQPIGRHSKLVETHAVLKNSFITQIKHITALAPEAKDPLLEEELIDLWNVYTTKIRQMIANAKTYPSKARDKGKQGKALVSFKIGKGGEIIKLLIESSSGHEVLDEAARMAVSNAEPFPPIPEKLNKQFAFLELPISFILR